MQQVFLLLPMFESVLQPLVRSFLFPNFLFWGAKEED